MAVPTDPLYAQQWHFGLIGNIARIWDDYRGSGVTVAVYDDGFQYDHPDLAGNYDASKHFTYKGVTYDPMPKAGSDSHGTACAGLIGAVANNGKGGVGVASEVTMTGVNYLVDIQTKTEEIMLASIRWASNFDIMSNSWGRAPNYTVDQSIAVDPSLSGQKRVDAAFKYIADTGRGGLGTINVKAAGNETMNANGDGSNGSRYTITVAATEKDGLVADYSNYGVAVLLAAPASAVTTDRTGENGNNKTGTANDVNGADPLPDIDYRTTFNGTSAATPTVAGVVALMLDANAGLGWRDVSTILGLSAKHTGSAYNAAFPALTEQGAWGSLSGTHWNGGGTAYHLSYGFGMLDAYAATRMAEVWTTLRGGAATSANEKLVTSAYTGPAVSIPDATFDFNFNLIVGQRALAFNVTQDVEIETVYVTVDIAHVRGSDLTLSLIMPDGTEIPLMTNEDATATATQTGLRWTFGVEALRGLSSVGSWQIVARDNIIGNNGFGNGVINSAKLEFFGAQNTANDIYTFTADFLTLKGLQAARGALDDLNGGADWINMAAIAGTVSSNLAAGGVTKVNGTTWFTVAAGSDKFENLVTGDGNDTVGGNTLKNHLMGMRGNDSLSGLNGDDTLVGGIGNDTLLGGNNNDVLQGDAGNDILNGGGGLDRAVFAGTASATVDLTRTGQQNTGHGLDTLTGVENLLSGSGADKLTGDLLGNVLDAGEGADTLSGGGGNDSLYGGNGDDALSGDAGDDLLDGGAGVDRAFFRGTAAAVVNLSLTGQQNTGYGLDTLVGIQNLTSGDGADKLTGNTQPNVLDGGGGADMLIGGKGNDTYVVNDAADKVVEALNEGNDTVLATTSYKLADNQHVEIIDLVYKTGTAAHNLTGNNLVNRIFGNAGNNVLDGKLGADVLTGRGGNDTYGIDNAGDTVIEAAGQGADTLVTSVSYVLADNQSVETLQFSSSTGNTSLNLTGNNLANTVFGNGGTNIIDGKGGADVLTGKAGTDSFAFTTALGSGNIDRITDFSLVDDTIRLSKSIFTGLSNGQLGSGLFKDLGVSGAKLDADDRLVYNRTTGALAFDSNGSGTGGSVQFATIDTKVLLTFQDFFVV